MTHFTQHPRRTFLSVAAAIAVLGAGLAHAQSPGNTHLVVPVPPGGGMDVTARIIADNLGKELGPVIVENKPGAALRLAIDYVKRAKPDGRTLLFSPTSPFTIYPHIYDSLSYDAKKDFIPVAPVVSFDFALGVPGNSPIDSVAEYIEAVNKNPAEFGMYAVPAAGAAPHFAGAQFARVAGINTTHVPYKGSAPAMQDLIGGHIPAIFNLTGEFVQYLDDKRVKVLATTGADRSPFTPDVPTFKELGFEDMVLSEWFGIFAPTGTPDEVVERVNALVVKAVDDPNIKSRFGTMGYTPLKLSTSQTKQQFEDDVNLWQPIVKASGFKVE